MRKKKTYTRDLHRHRAIQELMRRDPLGHQLTQLIVQLLKGYRECTTVPSLEKFGLFHAKLLPFITQLYGVQPEGDTRSALEAELTARCGDLCQKYHITALHITRETLLEDVKAEMVVELLDTIHGTSPLTLDAKQIAVLQEQFAQAFGMVAATCWGPRKGWKTLQYTRNWVPAGTPKLIIEPDSVYRTFLAEQAPPPGESPTLTITIALHQVTTNDLERLSEEFKAVVKEALQSLPTNHITDPGAVETALSHTLHGIPPTQPANTLPTLTVVLDCSRVNQRYLQRLENAFKAILRAVGTEVAKEGFERKLFRWDKFLRDLRRYDWHMQGGMSLREIAFQEQQLYEKARQTGEILEEPLDLPPSLESRKSGISMPGEDSVEQGVKAIYTAIYRHSYPVAGVEPDMEALNGLQYRCPYHPRNDCPTDCSNASAWMKTIRKWLPADSHGGSKEVPVSNDLLNTRRYGQFFFGEEYEDEEEESRVYDEASVPLLEAFEDCEQLRWFTGAGVEDGPGASFGEVDYLAAYEGEDEGYLEYPEEMQ